MFHYHFRPFGRKAFVNNKLIKSVSVFTIKVISQFHLCTLL